MTTQTQITMRNLETDERTLFMAPMNLEFWMYDKRKITLSISENGTSIQMPGIPITYSGIGFYARLGNKD